MSTVRENLIAARALIDTPEKWIREDYNRRKDCFCIIGALAHAGFNDFAGAAEDSAEYTALWAEVPNQGNYGYLHEYNDHPDTTHADILVLFDRAIEAQK